MNNESETTYYEQVRPPTILSESIECFWRLLVPLVVAPDEIISAENRAEILFQFHGQSQILPYNSDEPFDCASSWLMRPYSHALHVRQVGMSSSAMVGVRFAPGGWAAFEHDDTTERQSTAASAKPRYGRRSITANRTWQTQLSLDLFFINISEINRRPHPFEQDR